MLKIPCALGCISSGTSNVIHFPVVASIFSSSCLSLACSSTLSFHFVCLFSDPTIFFPSLSTFSICSEISCVAERMELILKRIKQLNALTHIQLTHSFIHVCQLNRLRSDWSGKDTPHLLVLLRNSSSRISIEWG